MNHTGVKVAGTGNLVVRNFSVNNNADYDISLGNLMGPTTGNPTNTLPWANFGF